jgi:hypothetical protein
LEFINQVLRKSTKVIQHIPLTVVLSIHHHCARFNDLKLLTVAAYHTCVWNALFLVSFNGAMVECKPIITPISKNQRYQRS